jgi:hypothetical protein
VVSAISIYNQRRLFHKLVITVVRVHATLGGHNDAVGFGDLFAGVALCVVREDHSTPTLSDYAVSRDGISGGRED